MNQADRSVLFVDESPWEAFFQLAAALRRRGVRTVRVSAGQEGSSAMRLVFNRTIRIPPRPTPEELAASFSDERILDLHSADAIAPTALTALEHVPPSKRSDLWVNRRAVLDKVGIADAVRALDLRVPKSLTADSVSSREAIDRLSLPIVLKPRIGASGDAVRVARTADELVRWMHSIEQPDQWMFEQFVQGRSLVYAAVAGPEGISAMAVYEVLSRQFPYGPALEAALLVDPKLSYDGARVVKSLQLQGIVCVDVIRDADGTDWIHDINPRAFSGFAMCQSAGVDLLDAYLHLLTRRPFPKSKGVEAVEGFVTAYPRGWRQLMRTGTKRSACIDTMRWTRRHQSFLGSRYLTAVVGRTITSAGTRANKALQLRWH